MSPQRVVPIGTEPLTDAGGKADGLQRLMQLGLPVPPAWVITAQACRDQLTKLGDASVETLREDILSSSLDAALINGIRHALVMLGPGPYAVRSSALAEDGREHSFAGQHDTALDVKDLEGVLQGVKRCWASAWADRAVSYRASAGLGADAAAMAVVIQRMVRADAAGVLFTRDPSGINGDALIIEAVGGLGEELVSGRAAPDRFVLSRADLSVTDRHIEAHSPIDDATLAKIARLGLQTEDAFGGPQDLEWAVEQGTPFLLQARPITTLATKPERKGPTYAWSNTNTGEVLPDVATPTTFAVVERYVLALLKPVLDALGIELRGAPLIGLVGGRVYFCLNTVAALFAAIPGMRRKSLSDVFGGDTEAMDRATASITPENRPDVGFSLSKALVGVPLLLWSVARHINVRSTGSLERARQRTKQLAALKLQSLSDAQLVARYQALADDVFTDLRECFFGVMVGSSFVGAITGLSRRWLGDESGAISSTFFSGLGGLDSAEAGLEQWRLAALARAPELLPHVAHAQTMAELRTRLGGFTAGRAYLERWDAFLRDHGHHARGEVDVAVPRWSEEPDAVLATVRAMAIGTSTIDPEALHRRRAAEREALEREHLGRLGLFRRRLFRFMLVRAQRGLTLRENMKSEAVRRLALTRETLLEIGRRLVERGRVERADDVFFLVPDDYAPALEGGTGWRSRVATARRDYVRNTTLTPPSVVVGDFDPNEALPPPPSDARLLRGLAVSPGVVEGRARVILRADAHQRLEPGEILVAPFTDPGWAPYFVAAAGLVVDMGGMLSHGSIVAREYGIPAVVNVGPGTRSIRTGQRIRVDGHAGLVAVLD